MVIYDVCYDGTQLVKSAYIYLSDQEKHAWYSAVPAYKKYLKLRKAELKSKHNIDLKLNILFSDRGPSDFWCAPFIYYAKNIATAISVKTVPTTTASGHGKYIHDQIGGGSKTTTTYGFKNDYIQINPGDSVASAAIKYLQTHYSSSLSGSINRYFFEIKSEEIKVRESPVHSLEIGTGSGIKTFHCCRIDTNGVIEFKDYLCPCDECIANEFRGNCNQVSYYGSWLLTKPIKLKAINKKSNAKSKSIATNNSPTKRPAANPTKPRKPRPVVSVPLKRNCKRKPQPQQYSVNKRRRLDVANVQYDVHSTVQSQPPPLF